MTINLKESSFAKSEGLFPLVYSGQLTQIVNLFNDKGQSLDQNDILQLLTQQDEAGRVPLDLACFLNFKNIALYLLIKSGMPHEYLG